jgi:integrase
VPLPKVEREEMRFLTPAEVATLAEAIQPRYRALVLVGAYGGLRIGELAGLRRSRGGPAARDGRGRRDHHRSGWLAARGTTQDPRQSPHRRATPRRGRGAGRPPGNPGPTGHLRVHRPKGGPLRVIAFRARIWRPATKNAGLGGLRIHDLRHTAVALWIAAGANPKEVAARAGHTSVSFTLDRYGHLYPESDTTLRDRLDAIDSTGERDQGAAVVELFRERSRPQQGLERNERRWVLVARR